ncbi:MAG: FecR family protein [Bacteroidales bacterium]
MNTEQLIIKYLTRESTAEENDALLQWVHSSAANKKEFVDTCKVWYASGKKQEAEKINKTHAFAQFKKRAHKKITQKTIQTPLWKYTAAAAAIIIVAVSTFFIVNQQQKPTTKTIANTEKTEKKVTLPDGSIICLHENATITFPAEFDNTKRSVSINGTAYCSVSKKEKKPFILKGHLVSVRVLGTKFYINSSTTQASVIVESGSVQVTDAHNTGESVFLKKGERADINKHTELIKTTNADPNYLSWKTGTLIFKKTPLHKVFSDIERHYNCSIIVTDETIYSEILTSTFDDLSLQEVCTMITSVFPSISYIKEGNTITFYK